MTTLELDRFMRKVDIIPGSCWEWRGSKDRGGYGKLKTRGKVLYAHRESYEHQEGEIPYPLELDHLCRNHGCVNPKHLEPVTHKVNLQRGDFANARKTHCPQGHEYDHTNKVGSRRCRICLREQGQRCYLKKKG